MKKLILLLIIFPLLSFGQGEIADWPPEILSDQTYAYKEIDGTVLNLWVFNPPKHEINSPKPAIIFFFGGGWRGGTPKQFEEHSKYLSARGIVSILADYRVSSRNKTKAIYCLKDAKSAIRWVRKNAKKLGVNPKKIISSGGSAGGHLAAATGTIKMFDDESEDQNISSKPNAMVLFNPVVITAPVKENKLENGFGNFINPSMTKRNMEVIGVNPLLFSPYHYINKGTPPTLIFHGESDTTVNPQMVILFNSKMKKFGNLCKLYLYQGEKHGFFNYGRKLNGAFIDSINKMDKFLVEIGYISAPAKSKLKQ